MGKGLSTEISTFRPGGQDRGLAGFRLSWGTEEHNPRSEEDFHTLKLPKLHLTRSAKSLDKTESERGD